MLRSRSRLLVACAVAAAVLAAAAIVLGFRSADPASRASAAARDALPAARAARAPMVVYGTNPDRRGTGGRVAVARLGAPWRSRTLTPLTCERVYVNAAAGLCLARGRAARPGYLAEIFGPDLRVRHALPMEGVPSRTRVSPDGRYGAVTFFVTGHAYAARGSFSTETTLIDLVAGREIAELEQFAVMRGGRRVTAIDVNFWGVTFARDSDRFYATMATGGKTYLIEGSVRAREAHVIHRNVECPSLSPDGTRVAYKKLTRSLTRPWRLTVLDLATMRETPLSEKRSVDDQAEWLDDDHVLYGVDGSVWSVRADGRGKPSRFIPGADSPAVVRW